MGPTYGHQHTQPGDGTTESGQGCDWWFPSHQWRYYHATTTTMAITPRKKICRSSHSNVPHCEGSGGYTNNLPYSNFDYRERPPKTIFDPICQNWYIRTLVPPSDHQVVEQFTNLCNRAQFRKHLQEQAAHRPTLLTFTWTILYVHSATMVLNLHLYINGSLAPRTSA